VSEDLTARFRLWNEDCPAACALLEQSPDGPTLTYMNQAFRDLFAPVVAAGKPILSAECRSELSAAFSGSETARWTAFHPDLGGWLSCRIRRLEPAVCELWVQYDRGAEESLLDSLPVAVVRYTLLPDGVNRSYANREAQRIYGAVSLEGSSLQSSPVPENAPAIKAIRDEFLARSEPLSYETRLRRLDGSEIWINGILSWVMPGHVCQTVFQDVTEKKESELRELRTRTLLENILSTTQTSIFWKDAQRRFLGANRAFLEYYGFSGLESLLGKTDEDMGWHPDPDLYRNDEVQVLRSGISTTRVPGRCLSHGESRYIVASKSPLYEDGKIVGLVGSFDDVTNETLQRQEIERLNGQLRAALEEAESASRSKSDFLARMSHDMRTPLTTVIGLCDLGLERWDDGELTSCFSSIRSSAEYLLSILSDILDMQKLAGGNLTLHPEVCTAARTARAVETIIRPQAEAKGITFLTDLRCDQAECFPMADTTRVQQVLINLLTNAVKYTPPGGTVTWETRVTGDAPDTLTVTHTVTDTGRGMSPEFQAHMYEPFTQERRDANLGGSGLGLAIVKKLVDLMGGSVSCDSQPGRGTRFTVVLPHQKADDVQAAAYRRSLETRAGGTVSGEGRKILICEDNDVNAEIIRKILSSRGFASDRAANGAEGVRMVREKRYDAVLMDVRMPVMDGCEAARAIRRFDRSLPVIALSANSFPEDVQRSLDAGMNAHLSKPIDLRELFETLSRLMEQSGKGGAE